jgi:hypothetical protein
MELGKFDPLRVYRLESQFFTNYGSTLGSWNNNRHERYREYLHQSQNDLTRLLTKKQPTNQSQNDNSQLLLRWSLFFIQAELINIEHLHLPQQGISSQGQNILWEILTHGIIDLLVFELAPLNKRIEALIQRLKALPLFLESLFDGVTKPSITWLISSYEILENFSSYLEWLETYVGNQTSNSVITNPISVYKEQIVSTLNYYQTKFQNSLSTYSLSEPIIEDRKQTFNTVLEYHLGLSNLNLEDEGSKLLEIKAKDSVYLTKIQRSLDPTSDPFTILNGFRKNTVKDNQIIINKFKMKKESLIEFFSSKFSWFKEFSPFIQELQIQSIPSTFQQLFRGPVYLSTSILRRGSSAKYWIPMHHHYSLGQITLKTMLDIFPGHHFLLSQINRQLGYPQKVFSFQETQKAILSFLLYLLKRIDFPFTFEESFEYVFYRRKLIIVGFIDLMLCRLNFSFNDAHRLLHNELKCSISEIHQITNYLEKFPGFSFCEALILTKMQDIFDQFWLEEHQSPGSNDLQNLLEGLLTLCINFYNAPPILFLEKLESLANTLRTST